MEWRILSSRNCSYTKFVCVCSGKFVQFPILTLRCGLGGESNLWSLLCLCCPSFGASGCGEAGLGFGEGFGMEDISRVGGLKEGRRSVSSGCRKGLGR